MDNLLLLPAPRRVERMPGSLRLADGRLISLQAAAPQALRFAAGRVQRALQAAGVRWELTAGPGAPAATVGLTMRLGEHAEAGAGAPGGTEGYTLDIRPDGIVAQAGCAAGLFYAACTLSEIIEQAAPELPCLSISDWPDFPARGVMLDVSRDKVPSMATLYRLVDMLAGWKINQLQLYTENTFAYRRFPEVWATASPLTGEEILDLDAYCRERYVELVPNQNSFGHLERWLRHPAYIGLAELVGEVHVPWGGTFRGPYSLCPLDPGSLDLLRAMYDELLPHFTSRMFNVGCDETWDLGQGRSRAGCAERGAERVYLDFLLQIQAEVQARGRTMQFWGDIVIQHPELLPPDLSSSIALEWGYEADHPFARHSAHFADAGIPFYVCPGTSTWCSIAGRTDNALANLRSAAESGLRHGAIGYLNTDWGDCGHWQAQPVSYLGFAAGAAYGWSLAANAGLDVAAATSLHAFGDATGHVGHAAYDLGNVYQSVRVVPHNNSALFGVLADTFARLGTLKSYGQLRAEDFHCAEEALEAAAAPLARAAITTPDAALVRREFDLTARLLQHACHRGLLWLDQDGELAPRRRYELNEDLQCIEAEFQSVWLARNRPGGLLDSLGRFEKIRMDYAA